MANFSVTVCSSTLSMIELSLSCCQNLLNSTKLSFFGNLPANHPLSNPQAPVNRTTTTAGSAKSHLPHRARKHQSISNKQERQPVARVVTPSVARTHFLFVLHFFWVAFGVFWFYDSVECPIGRKLFSDCDVCKRVRVRCDFKLKLLNGLREK